MRHMRLAMWGGITGGFLDNAGVISFELKGKCLGYKSPGTKENEKMEDFFV